MPKAIPPSDRSLRTIVPHPDYVNEKVSYLSHSVAHSVSSSSIPTPQSLEEAEVSPERESWMEAVTQEMTAMSDNGTWELVDRKPGMNVVKSKWVFTKKLKPDGSLDRFKARLVAKGFTQREGVDFKETFSPVVRYDTVRVLLSLAVQLDLDITQFDIKTAFLNGNLEEEIFMEQPQGFNHESNKVCRLLKSLYGLKQAPRSWYHKFKSVILEFGLIQSMTDPCLFTTPAHDLWLACYVDDGLIFTRNHDLKLRLLKKLEDNFELTLSDCSRFVGIQLSRSSDHILIHQESYCLEVLKRFWYGTMQTCSLSDGSVC